MASSPSTTKYLSKAKQCPISTIVTSQIKAKDVEIAKLRAESATNPSSAEERLNELQNAKSQLMAALDNDIPDVQRNSISECIQKMMASINDINDYIPKIVGECKANALKDAADWKSKCEIIGQENKILKNENDKCKEIIHKQAIETKELMKVINKISQSNDDQVDKIHRLEEISKRQEIMIQMLQKGISSPSHKAPLISKENITNQNKDVTFQVKNSVDTTNEAQFEDTIGKQKSAYKSKADTLKSQIKSLDNDIDGLRKNLKSVLLNQKSPS